MKKSEKGFTTKASKEEIRFIIGLMSKIRELLKKDKVEEAKALLAEQLQPKYYEACLVAFAKALDATSDGFLCACVSHFIAHRIHSVGGEVKNLSFEDAEALFMTANRLFSISFAVNEAMGTVAATTAAGSGVVGNA